MAELRSWLSQISRNAIACGSAVALNPETAGYRQAADFLCDYLRVNQQSRQNVFFLAEPQRSSPPSDERGYIHGDRCAIETGWKPVLLSTLWRRQLHFRLGSGALSYRVLSLARTRKLAG